MFFSWGRADLGALGLGLLGGDRGDGPEPVLSPLLVEPLRGRAVVQISGNVYHTAVVTEDGELFTMGNNDSGQLGVRRREGQPSPVRVDALEPYKIAHVACGQTHTVAVTDQGQLVSWGAAEFGQLGHGGNTGPELLHPRFIRSLEQEHRFVRVACGACHTLALTGSGEVFSFGQGTFGALGHGDEENREVPTSVAALWAVGVVQVACGENHSVALGVDRQVYSWGRGKYGQLGLGQARGESSPMLVRGLGAHATAQVSCGGDHTVALDADGRLWSWGRATWGQTGHGTSGRGGGGGGGNVLEPAPVRVGQAGEGDRDVRFVHVSAGARHTAAVADSGALYTWGNDEHGQLGRGGGEGGVSNGEPGEVGGLARDQPVLFAVAAGDHTFVAMGSGEGGGGPGSVGGAATGAQAASDVIPLPPLLQMAEQVHGVGAGAGGGEGAPRHALSQLVRAVDDVFSSAGYLIGGFALPGDPAADGNQPLPAGGGGRVGGDVAASGGLGEGEGRVPGADGGSGAPPPPPLGSGHGLDVDSIEDVYRALLESYSPEVVASLARACGRLLEGMERQTKSGAPQAPWLRALLVVMQCPLLGSSDSSAAGSALVRRVAHTASGLGAEEQQALVRWAAQYPGEVFGARFVRPIQRFITSRVQLLKRKASGDPDVIVCAKLLALLHAANEGGQSGYGAPLVAFSEFYNSTLSATVSLRDDYMRWIHAGDGARGSGAGWGAGGAGGTWADGTELCSFCQVPFILTPDAKSRILQGEANLQKRHEMHNSQIQALFSGEPEEAAQWLELRVRRSHLLDDTLNQIVRRPQDLKKPLKVTFLSAGVEEEGLDEGGVTKEFFQLLVRQIFRPEFGMFAHDDETRWFWFAHNNVAGSGSGGGGSGSGDPPTTLEAGEGGLQDAAAEGGDDEAQRPPPRPVEEAELEFQLVGIIVGLAIYNGVILDVHFPPVVYKKLMGHRPGLQDLQVAMPALGRGLQQLLDFEGDVEGTFCRTFQVEYECFGEIRAHDLVAGGESIPVTEANRALYVELYVQWTLEESVSRQFDAFASGFHQVCGGPALHLFRHEELELLVCGLPHLDFAALERGSQYDGGYAEDHPAVRHLWEVVHALSLDEKKRLLFFVTGCDRAPIGGLGQLTLTIQRSGPDTDRLPTSHTCFNILLLPEYASKAKLYERLLTAIGNAEGFGLQ